MAQNILIDNIQDVSKTLVTSAHDQGIEILCISLRTFVRAILRGLILCGDFLKCSNYQHFKEFFSAGELTSLWPRHQASSNNLITLYQNLLYSLCPPPPSQVATTGLLKELFSPNLFTGLGLEDRKTDDVQT